MIFRYVHDLLNSRHFIFRFCFALRDMYQTTNGSGAHWNHRLFTRNRLRIPLLHADVVCLYDRIQYSLKRVAVRLVQVPGAGVLVHAIAALE